MPKSRDDVQSKPPHPKWWNLVRAIIYNRSKRIFHFRKTGGWVIALCWGIGVSVALSAGFPPIPKELFYLAYALFLTAFVWSIGSFLTSEHLHDLNPISWSKTKKRKANLRRRKVLYHVWRLTVSLGFICLFGLSWRVTYQIENVRELSNMGGMLLPANDPDPVDYCEGTAVPSNSMRVYFGNSIAWSNEGKMSIIRFPKKEIIGLERGKNGEIFINADIISTDGKSVVQISRNRFDVNDNNIIKSLFTRPDRSTIILTDQYNNKLGIRYLNKHAIRIFGTLVMGSQYMTAPRTLQQMIDDVGKKRSVTITIPETGDTDVDGNVLGKACWPIPPEAAAIGVGE